MPGNGLPQHFGLRNDVAISTGAHKVLPYDQYHNTPINWNLKGSIVMKVLLILVDGMRPDALPHIAKSQQIIQKGAACLNATTVFPSVTLPCHISLFHSVDPDRHGIITNLYTPMVRPINGICEQLKLSKKTSSLIKIRKE